jgi:hypothetical protein
MYPIFEPAKDVVSRPGQLPCRGWTGQGRARLCCGRTRSCAMFAASVVVVGLHCSQRAVRGARQREAAEGRIWGEG